VFWHCPKCGGRTASLEFLRRNAAKEAIDKLWNAARNAAPRGALPCPACERRMVEVEARSAGGSVEVDVCAPCHFIWFDAGELEALPGKAPALAPEEIPLAARLSDEDRRELAHAQVEDLAVRHREARGEEVRRPETPFEWFRWLFGLPITARSRLAEVPVVTLLTTAAIAVIGIWTMGSDDATKAFGLVPAEWERLGGLTFFTSFFLHADAEHLVGNLTFFLIVGAGAEDLLGKGRFVLLLAAATLAGGIAHVLAEPASIVPCVGASGGISGLLTFFAAKNPSARIGLVFGLPWIRVPAGAVLLLWACLQLPELIFQLQGNTDVAATAHLGGAIAGVAFWLVYRKL
jgi:membrane associated rhomboid family serine protease